MAYGISIFNPDWEGALAQMVEIYDDGTNDPYTTEYTATLLVDFGAPAVSVTLTPSSNGIVQVRDAFVTAINASAYDITATAVTNWSSLQYDSYQSSYLLINSGPNSGEDDLDVTMSPGGATLSEMYSYSSGETRQTIDGDVIRVVDFGETTTTNGSVSIPDFDTTYGEFVFTSGDALLGAAETFPEMSWNNTTKVLSWTTKQLKIDTGSGPSNYTQFANKIQWYAIAKPGHPAGSGEEYKFVVYNSNNDIIVDASYRNIATVGNVVDFNWRTPGVWLDQSLRIDSRSYNKAYPALDTSSSLPPEYVYANIITSEPNYILGDSNTTALISAIAPNGTSSHIINTGVTGTYGGGSIQGGSVRPGSATHNMTEALLGIITSAVDTDYGLVIKNDSDQVVFSDRYTYPKLIDVVELSNVEDMSKVAGYININHSSVTKPFYSVVATHHSYYATQSGTTVSVYRPGVRRVSNTQSRLEWVLERTYTVGFSGSGMVEFIYQENTKYYVSIFDLEGLEPYQIVG